MCIYLKLKPWWTAAFISVGNKFVANQNWVHDDNLPSKPRLSPAPLLESPTTEELSQGFRSSMGRGWCEGGAQAAAPSGLFLFNCISFVFKIKSQIWFLTVVILFSPVLLYSRLLI